MHEPALPTGTRRLQVTWWSLYDLANTIYAASITYLFTLYFTQRFEATGMAVRTWLGLTTTVSMVLSGLCTPLLGAICDRTGNAHRYLVWSTLINVGAMLAWGFGGPAWLILAWLFVANFAYQTALLYYNALLPSVAPPERHGLVSGIGTGLGYFGNIVVLVSLLVLPPPDFARAEPYLAGMGIAFLLFALPCMVFVKDRRVIAAHDGAPLLAGSMRAMMTTLRDLKHHRALLFFLLGNFFLVDVLNTAIQFFGDYVNEVYADRLAADTLTLFGMPFRGNGAMMKFLGTLGLLWSLLAVVFGFVLGAFTDRRPLGVMRVSGAALGLALVGGALFGGGDTTMFFCTLVVFAAVGLAGIWTAGRKLVLVLAPPERIGEFFGLYGITVKVSVIGSTVYGVVADHHGPQAALLAQMVQLVLGLGFLLLVRLPAARHAAAP
jgi:UMF1 family MFS transporter